MRVHFSTIDVESGYDVVYIGDSDLYSGSYYDGYSGYGTNVWSLWIPLLSDNTFCVRLISDSSINSWGFEIDQYEVIMDDGTHYLCSYDSIPSASENYYIDTLLDSKLDSLNCLEKYMVLDSCNSGGMIPETQSNGRFIITASEADELSLEDSARQNGCFTYNFLRSLDMATDSNGDGVISIEEQYDYTYSTTVTRSNALGYTHHPQEYDGISGESILFTSINSENFNLLENQLDYTFQISGTGTIDHLVLGICAIDSSNVYDYSFLDLTLNPSSSTGFGMYSGTISLAQGLQATGWGLFAEVSGNRLINLDHLVSPDTDNDGIIDIMELYLGISPISIDTDNDGLTDYEEIFTYNTDPNSSDTDGDAIPDGWEVINNLNPIGDDASDDPDGDGLTNLKEFQNNINPNNPDTDDDGMPDGWKVTNNLNPIVDDASEDPDEDGLTNLQEFQNGSDPNIRNSIFIEVPPDQTISIGTHLNLTWVATNLNAESYEIYLDGEIIETGLWISSIPIIFPIMEDLELLPGDHEFTIELTDNLGNIFSDTVIITIEIEYGDVNADGVVDIVDALLTAQYYVGLNIPGFHAEVADVNLDGLIDIVDALLIA